MVLADGRSVERSSINLPIRPPHSVIVMWLDAGLGHWCISERRRSLFTTPPLSGTGTAVASDRLTASTVEHRRP
jgi:hypothetical protein